MSHTPYYYAPGGKCLPFPDLLGFTAFVRSSFEKKAEESDDREKEFELAQKQFKIAQAEVDREYRRVHEHLEELVRRPSRRGKAPAMSVVFSDCPYVVFDRPKDAERFAVHAMRSFIRHDMPVRMGERQVNGSDAAPGAAEVPPDAQRQGPLRRRVQPHAFRA